MIPLIKPYIDNSELAHLKESLQKRKLSGDGEYSKKCADFLEGRFKAKKVLFTPSCTHSLELAAIALDLKEGDEVILPSYSFVSTANAFVLRGARPVFVDVREDTLNIDENKIEQSITPKTKAIVALHYAGVSCEMDKIMEIAKKHNLAVIEDAAQAVNSKYDGKYVGTIGDFGCYSFHDTKNYTCGEGGAIVVNASHLSDRVEIIREKGTNRKRFFRGEVDKYSWVDIGSSFLLADVLAAMLYAQFEKMDEINSAREKVYNKYLSGLDSLRGRITLPVIPEKCESNYHIFHILAKDEEERNKLEQFLKANDIIATFHYLPLHLSEFGKRYGHKVGEFPITESVSGRVLRLPIYPGLKEEEQNKVIDKIKEFYSVN